MLGSKGVPVQVYDGNGPAVELKHFEERSVPFQQYEWGIRRVWRLKRDHTARYFLTVDNRLYVAKTTRTHQLTPDERREVWLVALSEPVYGNDPK